MIRLILAVVFALLTAALGAFLALNPGHASFEFLGVQTEMPFVVAAGGVILFAFLMLVIWWGIYLLWTSPDKVKGFMGRRRREQGYDALEKALIASAAGDGEAAVRQAARADALLDRPALSRLLAARAAESAGNLDGAQTHYEALLEDQRTRVVARRGLAQLSSERGDLGATIDHAADAFQQAKGARWAFDALFDAQVAKARWQDALTTLTEGERRKHVAPDTGRRRRSVLLTAAALEAEINDAETARELAVSAHRAAPGFAPAAALAARLLADGRRHKRAAEVLESAWAAAPHPALARAFQDLRKSDTKAKRMERLKALAELNPDHRESRLILIQTALEEGDAPAARTLLDPLMESGQPSSRLCALSARLARLDGKDELARRWMTRASHAGADADWSDIDPEGRLFAYTPDDWKRMVYVFGDENRLTHPRYERYERAAGAVPETALLDAPRPVKSATSRTASFADTPARMPDDPGVPDEGEGKPGRSA
ncbi:heme biosynthesis protein HemY [Maricaulis sp. W15]|uniref:heme biosynthesis protein HemY n=1 Tax=Maricaulis sp. W15 TaxID=1772333 RepID=UPI000948EE29|nr:heme biosynthesis HemY N-terminal domain-containing protein [Maricaulis sp. W15]OLF80703.1 heme biosynthesis protein HemY [Maricaulis sp. W15]